MSIDVLHLSLVPVAGLVVELRYFTANPNQYEVRSLTTTEIQDLVALKEGYGGLSRDLLAFGRRLLRWLDGGDRWLSRLLRDRMVLAIACGEVFSQLPWEILADEVGVLVDRGIVAVMVDRLRIRGLLLYV